jgi:hypothetical protein
MMNGAVSQPGSEAGMTRYVCGLLVLAAGAFAAAAEQDAVTLKDYEAKPGDRIRYKTEERSANTVFAGEKKGKTETKTESLIFVEEVVEKPAGARRPTRLRRLYEKAEQTKNGAPVGLALKGKTVVIEKKDDRYTFAFDDGKPLNAAASALLDRHFNKPNRLDGVEALFPKMPVKVGETWELDKEAVAKKLWDTSSGLAIDKTKTTATGKLAKAGRKNDVWVGVIEWNLGVVPTVYPGKEPIPLKDGSRVELALTFDGCLDGTSPNARLVGKMGFKMVVASDVADLTFNGESTKTTTAERLPGK